MKRTSWISWRIYLFALPVNMVVLVFAADHELLGRMLTIAPRLAQEQGCRPGDSGGFRVVINNGADGGQEVYHLHMHVMGGPRPWNKN